MFYEYALEPAVISSWDRTRFFLDAFGPSKGRFLAEYPRHWKRMVVDGLRCQPVERLKIVERLRRVDKRIFSSRTDAVYEGALTWFENAEIEHSRKPFRAIVASRPAGPAHVLDGAEVDDTNELWRVEPGALTSREPSEFVRMLRPLLEASKRVVIIDPYFRADHYDKTQPLVAFCEQVVGKAEVQVHFSDEPRGYNQCMSDAAYWLPGLLPVGMSVTLHCWRMRQGGARLHNRYLLTEVGGVKFGDGIEIGSSGQEDHLSILDESSRASLWDQYAGATPAFDSAGLPREFCGVTSARRR